MSLFDHGGDNGFGYDKRGVQVNVDHLPELCRHHFAHRDTLDDPCIIDKNINDANFFFYPGDGGKDTLTIPQSGSSEDLWEGGIYDSSGNRVRLFGSTGNPSDLVWDGKDDGGGIVPDGVYSYRLSSTDRARNSTEKSLDNIIVSTIQPAVNLHISGAWFSPNGDGIKDTVGLTPGLSAREGIAGWEIRIRDAGNTSRRVISGTGAPPEKTEFDGRDGGGVVLGEGA